MAAKNDIFNGHHAYGWSTSAGWLTCTGRIPAIIKDVKAEKITLKTSSIHADRGTAVHELCELCLKSGCKPIQYLGKKLKGGNNTFTVDESFIEAANVYIKFVKRIVRRSKGELLIEKSFDMSEITNADCGGSADTTVIDLKKGILYVIDYKNGHGIVEVFNNTQLWGYGMGAYLELTPAQQKKIKEVHVSIVQPNVYHVDGKCRTQIIKINKLIRWFNKKVIPAIAKSESGKGEFVSTEKGCEWCPRAGYCEANNKKALESLGDDFKIESSELLAPNELTKEQVKLILDNRKRIEKYFQSVYFYSLGAVDKGEEIEGYKLVKSISNRKYKNAGRVERKLQRKLKHDFHQEPSIKTPAQLEKHLKAIEGWDKKKIEKFMNSCTERTETGVKLVPDSDFGESVSSTLYEDFGT